MTLQLTLESVRYDARENVKGADADELLIDALDAINNCVGHDTGETRRQIRIAEIDRQMTRLTAERAALMREEISADLQKENVWHTFVQLRLRQALGKLSDKESSHAANVAL